jgi:hypothetical protein
MNKDKGEIADLGSLKPPVIIEAKWDWKLLQTKKNTAEFESCKSMHVDLLYRIRLDG